MMRNPEKGQQMSEEVEGHRGKVPEIQEARAFKQKCEWWGKREVRSSREEPAVDFGGHLEWWEGRRRMSSEWHLDSPKWQVTKVELRGCRIRQTVRCKDSEKPEVEPLAREDPRVLMIQWPPASLPKHLLVQKPIEITQAY